MNITIDAHLTRENGSDYIYSFLEFTPEQAEEIAAQLHLDPEDVDDYINDTDYFGDHGETSVRAYLDSHDSHNLIVNVSGSYEYPGVTLEVDETFEHMEDCAEALRLCDMFTLEQLVWRRGGKAYGELQDRLVREADRRQAELDRDFQA